MSQAFPFFGCVKNGVAFALSLYFACDKHITEILGTQAMFLLRVAELRLDHLILVVCHLPGKTGWSTACTNGTQKSPVKNFQLDWHVPIAQPLLNDVICIKIEVGLLIRENCKWQTHFTFRDVPKILNIFWSATPKTALSI